MQLIDYSIKHGRCGFYQRIMSLMEEVVLDRADRFVSSADEDLGRLELELGQGTNRLLREVLAKALQEKADGAGADCPDCGGKLTKKRRTSKTIRTMSGPITIKRLRGWCAKCKKWVCPADRVMKIDKGYTPRAEETAALFASKMPIEEAARVMKHVTGLEMPKANLDRLVKKVGKDAESLLEEMDEQTRQGQVSGGQQRVQSLVIEIDAWNIRERDQWGQSEKLRRKGEEPSRWHWVWTATIFSLDQRLRKGNRAQIVDRGYVATTEGIDRFRQQLHAEALRRGLGDAEHVLVLGDGAAWIWNLATDRFKEADQRLDFYHLQEHLWEVARELYPEAEEAKKWIKRKKRQLKTGKAPKVIDEIETALDELRNEQKETVQKQVNYLREHQNRMDYDKASQRGEPLGSGAIESTCRQYQCRMKRPGQFWSRSGDQALLALNTLWLNQHWSHLFPHSTGCDPSKN